MYSEPIIVETKDLLTRAYVKTYINGKRYRLYNGFAIGITCSPNRAKTVRERSKALHRLCYEFRKVLEKGWTPDTLRNTPVTKTILAESGVLIENIVREVDRSDLSKLYQRDIRITGLNFIQFLRSNGLYSAPIGDMTATIIETYLKQFSGSSTYYMNKRRTLGAIFSRIGQDSLPQNPVLQTNRRKEKSVLHEPYTKEQIKLVLEILRTKNSSLYLCALLMYGCLLRPHQEIRALTGKHFNEDWTKILLGGKDNKGGRVRVVPIPEYVRVVLIEQKITNLSGEVNIFTHGKTTLNESYFNTAWSRIKSDLLKDGIIGKNHTLYSFRHTAAINLYMKTRDLYKVQQAMGHSSMTVTLTYMRSLGQINTLTVEDIPEL